MIFGGSDNCCSQNHEKKFIVRAQSSCFQFVLLSFFTCQFSVNELWTCIYCFTNVYCIRVQYFFEIANGGVRTYTLVNNSARRPQNSVIHEWILKKGLLTPNKDQFCSQNEIVLEIIRNNLIWRLKIYEIHWQ